MTMKRSNVWPAYHTNDMKPEKQRNIEFRHNRVTALVRRELLTTDEPN